MAELNLDESGGMRSKQAEAQVLGVPPPHGVSAASPRSQARPHEAAADSRHPPNRSPSLAHQVLLGVVLGFAAIGSIFGGLFAFAQLVAHLMR